jgi:hypothetical protein
LPEHAQAADWDANLKQSNEDLQDANLKQSNEDLQP